MGKKDEIVLQFQKVLDEYYKMEDKNIGTFDEVFKGIT